MADPIRTTGNPDANTTTAADTTNATTTPAGTTPTDAGPTTTGTTAGATGPATGAPRTTGTTKAYEAETVRTDGAATTAHKTSDSAATKGLIVGVLTFVVLSLWEWIDGPTGSEGDAITFPEIAIYAVVGIVVGVVVKMIDKSRHKSHT